MVALMESTPAAKWVEKMALERAERRVLPKAEVMAVLRVGRKGKNVAEATGDWKALEAVDEMGE